MTPKQSQAEASEAAYGVAAQARDDLRQAELLVLAAMGSVSECVVRALKDCQHPLALARSAQEEAVSRAWKQTERAKVLEQEVKDAGERLRKEDAARATRSKAEQGAKS
jgi:hypothetical protein